MHSVTLIQPCNLHKSSVSCVSFLCSFLFILIIYIYRERELHVSILLWHLTLFSFLFFYEETNRFY